MDRDGCGNVDGHRWSLHFTGRGAPLNVLAICEDCGWARQLDGVEARLAPVI